MLLLLVAQAEPAVLDLDREPSAHRVAVDHHRCVRRGEHRGVLRELGDHVNDVTDHGADERGAGRRGGPDPGVVLDLGDRGAQHVDQRHRVPPAPGRRVAGQDDQAFRVPPHAGGQVVDAEQVLEFLRIPGPALHRIEQCELAVQQRLAAPGQVAEDLAHALPQPGLPDGGPHGGLLDRGERVPHLADLVGGGRDVRGLGGDVDILAQRQPVHHLGQPLVRQGQRGLAQAAQLPHQAAGGEDGDDDGDDHQEQADAAGHDELEVRGPGDVTGLRGDRVGGLKACLREPGGDRAHGLLPGER